MLYSFFFLFLFADVFRSRFWLGQPVSHHKPHRLSPQYPHTLSQAKHAGPVCRHRQPRGELWRSIYHTRAPRYQHLYSPMRFAFSCAGSGFSSKPTTPTGPSPFMPPMGSPSRPPASPQHTAGFPSWQPGPGSGGGWQTQGQGTPPQPKPSPSHTPMSHNSPQNRPNYNVSFSAVGGGSPSAGSKAQAGLGEQETMKPTW